MFIFNLNICASSEYKLAQSLLKKILSSGTPEQEYQKHGETRFDLLINILVKNDIKHKANYTDIKNASFMSFFNENKEMNAISESFTTEEFFEKYNTRYNDSRQKKFLVDCPLVGYYDFLLPSGITKNTKKIDIQILNDFEITLKTFDLIYFKNNFNQVAIICRTPIETFIEFRPFLFCLKNHFPDKEIVKIKCEKNDFEKEPELVNEYTLPLIVNRNIVDKRDQSFIHAFSCKGRPKKLELLLKNGEDPNQFSSSGYRPLHYVCDNDLIVPLPTRIKIVNLLLEYCANINIKNNSNKTPLILAAKNYHMPIVQILVDHMIKTGNKLSLNMQDEQGRTALYRSGRYECDGKITDLLAKAGTNVDLADNSGDTPLHHFCRYNCIESTKIVLEHGANPNAVNKNEESVLLLACIWNRLKIVKYLLEKGANFNFCNKYTQETPLSVVCKGGMAKIAKVFLEFGYFIPLSQSFILLKSINKEKCSETLYNALVEEITKQHPHYNPIIFRTISSIAQKCQYSINMSNLERNILETKDLNKIEELLKLEKEDKKTNIKYKVINPNATIAKDSYVDGEGNTVLHYLCNQENISQKDLEIATLLINYGAKVNIVNDKNETPLSLACKKGHTTLVSFLLMNNAYIYVNGISLVDKIDKEKYPKIYELISKI